MDITNLLNEVITVTFILQYFASKGLDKIGTSIENHKSENLIHKVERFLCDAIVSLYDENSIAVDEEVLMDKLEKFHGDITMIDEPDYIVSILNELLGDDFKEIYGDKLIEELKTQLRKNLKKDEYRSIFIEYILNNQDKFKVMNGVQESSNNFIESELKRLWKTIDDIDINDDHKLEKKIKKVKFFVEENRYNEALDLLIDIMSEDINPELEYTCALNMAVCNYHLHDGDGSLRWIKKAEELFGKHDLQVDKILLYRNLALAYIGVEDDKIKNAKISNQYFEKLAEIAKEENEDYYVLESIIYQARNNIDITSSLPLAEGKLILFESLSTLFQVVQTNDELSEEHGYVVIVSLGRGLCLCAERENNLELYDIARIFFKELLKVDYCIKNPNYLALILDNIALTYQYGKEKDLDKALRNYEQEFDLYKRENNTKYLRTSYKMSLIFITKYKETQNIKFFDEAKSKLSTILATLKLEKNSILSVQVYYSLADLYIVKAKFNQDKSEALFKQAKNYLGKAEDILSIYPNEKFEMLIAFLSIKLQIEELNENSDLDGVTHLCKTLNKLTKKTRNHKNLHDGANSLNKDFIDKVKKLYLPEEESELEK